MFMTLLLISMALFGVLLMTFLHAPVWVQRTVLRIPAWLQAVTLHVGYAAWVGGVTGHLVGGLLSLPWFVALRWWLTPKGAIQTGHRFGTLPPSQRSAT